MTMPWFEILKYNFFSIPYNYNQTSIYICSKYSCFPKDACKPYFYTDTSITTSESRSALKRNHIQVQNKTLKMNIYMSYM